MTYHSQLNLIMLATIIGVAVFLYLKPQLQAVTEDEFQVSIRDPETVQTIRILRQGKETVLRRSDRDDAREWHVTSPFHARASVETIDKILNILSANSRQRFPLTDSEAFNLDQPGIELYLDDDYFAFGGMAPTTDKQYLVINQHVYLVSPRYAIWIPVQPLDAASPRLLEADETPVRFDLPDLSLQSSGAQNGEWHVIDGMADGLPASLLQRWVQLWRQSDLPVAYPDQQIESAAQPVASVTLQNGQKIEFSAVHDPDGTLIFRDGEQVGYYFSAEQSRQLLNPYSIE